MYIECKNCKHRNPPTAVVCSDCKASLQGSLGIGGVSPLEGRDERICDNCGKPTPTAQPICIHCGYRAELPEATRPYGQDAGGLQQQQGGIGCISCGYLNLASAAHCVQCGAELRRIAAVNPIAANAEIPADLPQHLAAPDPVPIVISPSVAHEISAGKTIPFGELLAAAKAQSFSLTPLPRSGEQPPAARQFSGEEVLLNRDNLDPGNMSLTSKLQACLRFEDGAWVLSDGSEQQSTFLRVSRPQPLQDGDVLLLGNRLFRFTIQ